MAEVGVASKIDADNLFVVAKVILGRDIVMLREQHDKHIEVPTVEDIVLGKGRNDVLMVVKELVDVFLGEVEVGGNALGGIQRRDTPIRASTIAIPEILPLVMKVVQG